MKILDKYIVKKFFTIFPIFIISLVSLICLITYVIDIFVLGNGTTERHGFFHTIYFYFVSTVVTFNIIIPFLAFISSALISLQLANRNEFVSFFSQDGMVSIVRLYECEDKDGNVKVMEGSKWTD